MSACTAVIHSAFECNSLFCEGKQDIRFLFQLLWLSEIKKSFLLPHLKHNVIWIRTDTFRSAPLSSKISESESQACLTTSISSIYEYKHGSSSRIISARVNEYNYESLVWSHYVHLFKLTVTIKLLHNAFQNYLYSNLILIKCLLFWLSKYGIILKWNEFCWIIYFYRPNATFLINEYNIVIVTDINKKLNDFFEHASFNNDNASIFPPSKMVKFST